MRIPYWENSSSKALASPFFKAFSSNISFSPGFNQLTISLYVNQPKVEFLLFPFKEIFFIPSSLFVFSFKNLNRGLFSVFLPGGFECL
jgi:hypothetical protein